MTGPNPSSQRRLGSRRVKGAAVYGALHSRLHLSPPGAPAFAGATGVALALAFSFGVAAAPVVAQVTERDIGIGQNSAPPAPKSDRLKPAPEIIAALPDTLVGAVALKMPDSPIVMYMPRRLGQDPIALVMATRGAELPAAENMAEQVRGSFHESGLRQIVREGTFRTPKWPNATTFFGEYVAGSGRKQSWTVIDGDVRVNVMVTYFKAKDGPRMEAEVSEKIFGGAVITAGKDKPK